MNLANFANKALDDSAVSYSSSGLTSTSRPSILPMLPAQFVSAPTPRVNFDAFIAGFSSLDNDASEGSDIEQSKVMKDDSSPSIETLSMSKRKLNFVFTASLTRKKVQLDFVFLPRCSMFVKT